MLDVFHNNVAIFFRQIVNFADNLTHVRFFVDHDESDMDSLISTGGKYIEITIFFINLLPSSFYQC